MAYILLLPKRTRQARKNSADRVFAIEGKPLYIVTGTGDWLFRVQRRLLWLFDENGS